MNEKSSFQDRDELGLIKDSIDKHLGPDGARLVFKTLKLVYKIDERTAIQHPDLLVERMQKILGNRTAERLLSEFRRNWGSS